MPWLTWFYWANSKHQTQVCIVFNMGCNQVCSFTPISSNTWTKEMIIIIITWDLAVRKLYAQYIYRVVFSFIIGYTNTSSMGYTQVTSSLFTPISTNLGLNQASTYSNAGLGSLGTSMGSGDAFGELNIVLNPLFYYTNISSMGYTIWVSIRQVRTVMRGSAVWALQGLSVSMGYTNQYQLGSQPCEYSQASIYSNPGLGSLGWVPGMLSVSWTLLTNDSGYKKNCVDLRPGLDSKPACSASESWSPESCGIASISIILSRQWTTKQTAGQGYILTILT